MKYEIIGGAFPVVICTLSRGEQMITEKGSMSWMSPCMKMETSGGGGLGKMFSRAIAGESLFQNIFTAQGDGIIAFGSSFPGKIIPFNVGQCDMIVQKSAFLASESTVTLSTHFTKKAGVGFFGGEGFIMQRLSGRGIAFIEIDGDVVEYNLQPGQQIIVDTGNVAGFEATVSIDIQQVAGIKNMLLGIAIIASSIALASVLSYFLEYVALAIGACFVLYGYFRRD